MTATALGLERTGRIVLTGLWIDAGLVMVASAWNGGRALESLGDPFGVGVLLGVAVDVGLAASLVGDRALHLHGRTEPWGRAVRVTTALMSLGLNCAVAISGGHYGLAIFHAFLPLLLVLLSEYAQSSTLQFHAIAAEHEARQRELEARREQPKPEPVVAAPIVVAPAVAPVPRSQRTQVARPTKDLPSSRQERRDWAVKQLATNPNLTGSDVDRRFGPPRNGAAVIKEAKQKLAEQQRGSLHIVGGK